jgi:hypothetical protein
LEYWEELCDGNDEKEQIEEELELMEEDNRDKGDDVVFLVLDLIVREGLWSGISVKTNLSFLRG